MCRWACDIIALFHYLQPWSVSLGTPPPTYEHRDYEKLKAARNEACNGKEEARVPTS